MLVEQGRAGLQPVLDALNFGFFLVLQRSQVWENKSHPVHWRPSTDQLYFINLFLGEPGPVVGEGVLRKRSTNWKDAW